MLCARIGAIRDAEHAAPCLRREHHESAHAGRGDRVGVPVRLLVAHRREQAPVHRRTATAASSNHCAVLRQARSARAPDEACATPGSRSARSRRSSGPARRRAAPGRGENSLKKASTRSAGSSRARSWPGERFAGQRSKATRTSGYRCARARTRASRRSCSRSGLPDVIQHVGARSPRRSTQHELRVRVAHPPQAVRLRAAGAITRAALAVHVLERSAAWRARRDRSGAGARAGRAGRR